MNKLGYFCVDLSPPLSPATMASIPPPLASFISKFPLTTHPRIPLPPNNYRPVQTATLWLSPPLGYNLDGSATSPTADNIPNLLSADVECLKWQAYIALRGLKSIRVRFDVQPDGALQGRLPNLHVPLSEAVLPKDDTQSDKARNEEPEKDGELLAAQMIPTWADAKLGVDSSADANEGYTDENTRDESRAWVSLLEGAVHAALVCTTSILLSRRIHLSLHRFSPNRNLRTCILSSSPQARLNHTLSRHC